MDRIKYLLLQFLREQSTPAEQAELEAWLNAGPANQALLAELQDQAVVTEAMIDLDQLDRAGQWEKVHRYAEAYRPAPEPTTHYTGRLEEIRERKPVRRMSWIAAAAIIALLGTGAWWLFNQQLPTAPTVATANIHDVPAPARSCATLTLAGGQQLDLDSAASGTLAAQGNTHIQKTASGQIAYLATGAPGDALLYNTLTNPRGSQLVTLTLSDGTRVWLNAESSIRYPAVFIGGERTVEMTGEAYFEVAKDAAKLFKVTAVGQTINVLGTSFNVNAYVDEPDVSTTLVEGKVQVEIQGTGKVLTPGMQLAASRQNQGISVTQGANIEKVLAWKNGRFAFEGADVQTVMRQLARWYDVTVSFEGAIPHREFNGKLNKTLTLDQVLQILTKTRIHYTIEPNRQLIIRP